MVVEVGETRSEVNADEIVLNETVDIDDSDSVKKLNAGDKHKDNYDDGVD